MTATTTYTCTPSPRRYFHSRTPTSPSPTFPLLKDTPTKHRSSTSLSLLGSLIRALKINPKNKKKGPTRSMIIRGDAGGRRTLSKQHRLFKMRSMPERRRWEELGPGLGPSWESGRTHDNDGTEQQQYWLDTDPPQYLLTKRKDTNLAEENFNPFKTPPRTPTTHEEEEEEEEEEEGTYHCTPPPPPSPSPGPPLPLSPLENTSLDSSSSSLYSIRRRAERSRMKSLQLLGPEAAEAIREKWAI